MYLDTDTVVSVVISLKYMNERFFFIHFYFFQCEGIVEEFEDEISNELKEPSEDPVTSICAKATRLCDNEKDEL